MTSDCTHRADGGFCPRCEPGATIDRLTRERDEALAERDAADTALNRAIRERDRLRALLLEWRHLERDTQNRVAHPRTLLDRTDAALEGR